MFAFERMIAFFIGEEKAMKKPLIGVIPLIDEFKESYWMLPGYLNGLLQAGGLPVMLPLTSDRETLQQCVETCDGFLFTGGHDVSPSLYGEETLPVCGACCPERDEMEAYLFAQALERNQPILGICRGIQLINALMGGTLYQDLPTQKPSLLEHHQTPPYDEPIHTVKLVEHTPLAELFPEKEVLEVNSYHHQAIKTLAPGLQPMAYAPDGLVEAVYAPGKKYLWAVQWHPEFSFEKDANSRAIFQSFVQAMRL